ncbi:MAG TPA: outer membrane beta-barrel protein [Croceibacterium sp.]|nr:outer membrane beta-barrel protein [Croceibacterium sp.]
MKIKFALIAAAAALVAATPAAANEGRAEVRGGIAWADGNEEAVAGIAVGYDFDAGSQAFFGLEGSADKVLVDGADVAWGLTARAGAKLGTGKLFATAGYTFDEFEDMPHLGAGYEHTIGRNTYVKIEYRHMFSDFADPNTVVAGLGVRF